ncbi:MAG: hypothetical protein ACD_51C00258G0002 [uncultured bacterium]|nr:MAG: hypothetical protein ACD_51C00258G0002 [uncultured bacterium]KKT02655.1 MAG: RND family efflux transporter MFP subunit, HlyD family secretion protein [Candidatus Peregrinibacteria bacterium GW2011_GWF2_43_17]HAU39834.1 hypothetical protein [Candidatus Peregrinibacteria bacterium]
MKKIIVIGLIAALSGFIGYSVFYKTEAVSEEYVVLGKIQKGNISLSIQSSGQVSNADEIELNPDKSGIVGTIHVEEDQYVSEGDPIMSFDTTDSEMAVRSAEIDLEKAQLALEELQEPVDEMDIKNAENSVTQAENDLTQLTSQYETAYANKQDDIADLEADYPTAYNSAFNAATEIFVGLPDVLESMDDIVQGHNMAQNMTDITYYLNSTSGDDRDPISAQKDKVITAYYASLASYDTALDSYQEISRENTDQIEILADATYEAVYDMSEALKELDVFLALVYDEVGSGFLYADVLSSQRTDISNSSGTINPILTSIYDEIENIDGISESITDAQEELEDLTSEYELNKQDLELTLEGKELDLEDIQSTSATDLEIRAQELTIEEKENALSSAQNDYEDNFVYAPISGYISELDIDVGETVSTSTVVATLIDDSKQIVVSLNELDVLDVKVGQSAVVTFDAIEGLEADAIVVERSDTGDVNSGVVSYDITLSILNEDERILTGMSADVDIVLISSDDVLLIPQTAIKEDTDGKYAEVVTNIDQLAKKSFYLPSELTTEKKYLEIGEEDDTNAEVISGLNEGDLIVLMTTIVLSSEEDTTLSTPFSGGGGEMPSGDMGSGPPSM